MAKTTYPYWWRLPLPPVEVIPFGPDNPLPGDLVPLNAACQIAGIKHSALVRMIRQGKLRAFGRRPRMRVSISELLPTTNPAKVRLHPDFPNHKRSLSKARSTISEANTDVSYRDWGDSDQVGSEPEGAD